MLCFLKVKKYSFLAVLFHFTLCLRGYDFNKNETVDTLLELRYDSNEWTQLSERLKQPRWKHVVIPIPK